MEKEATSSVICKFKRDFCNETYYGERLVNSFYTLTISKKNSIVDARLGSKYASQLPQVCWFYCLGYKDNKYRLSNKGSVLTERDQIF